MTTVETLEEQEDRLARSIVQVVINLLVVRQDGEVSTAAMGDMLQLTAHAGCR